MAELSEQQKEAIVTLIARFTRPADVVVHMREEWGVEIDRFQVRAYDPTNPRYEAGDKWRCIFDAARATYLTDVGKVPIAHKGYRLNQLQGLFDRASISGNIALAGGMLEQAAKEIGGALTNEQVHRVSGPRPAAQLTPEERREKLAEVIRQAMEGMNAPIQGQPARPPEAPLKAA